MLPLWEHAPLLSLLLCMFLLPATELRAGTTANITGVLYSIGSDKVRVTWPDARVTLKNKQTGIATSTITNDRGEFHFTGVAAGDYELTTALTGFENETRELHLEANKDQRLDISLRPHGQKEQVIVTAQGSGVELAPNVQAGPELTQEILDSVPLVNDRFQDALPLIPGVVRGPDGTMNIKGGRGNQSSTLLNSTNVADPVSGQPSVDLPAAAVQSVRVLSNPFSSEYGRFAGGVVELETVQGTDQWKFRFDDFFPRMRFRDGSIVGIEDIGPRLTLAGPLVKGKLYFFQMAEYDYNRTRVPAQPNLRNDLLTEVFHSITQLDWNITSNNRLSGTVWVYPEYRQHIGMNTFNSEDVTPNARTGGFFVSLRERSIFPSGGFLDSSFSVRRQDFHIYPVEDSAPSFVLFPEQNSGTYFSTNRHTSFIYQGSQTYHNRPSRWHGIHLLELGYSVAHSNYDGTVSNGPVDVVREDQTLSQSIVYSGAARLTADNNDFALFVQDRWQLHPRFSLDFGLRVDREGVSRDAVNAAPRVAFVFAPMRDNKTAVRGGVGLFYDKVPLSAVTFLRYPAQTITSYAPDGLTVLDGPATFTHIINSSDGQLHVPYSISWNFQVDRELRPKLLARFGYEERQTRRDLLVDPTQTPQSSELVLSNGGRQHYREFQLTLRWQPTEHTQLFSSYVHSHATGDLNGFEQFFSNTPNPIIRPNQSGLLPFDTPNRFLVWGYTTLPGKIQFAPVLEVRTGFPYSKWDSNLDYIGPRNGAGRFPEFVSFDMQVSRPFVFHYREKMIQIKPAVRFFDITNHDNPRDVQQNITSPNFGGIYNSVGRLFRWRIDVQLLGKK